MLPVDMGWNRSRTRPLSHHRSWHDRGFLWAWRWPLGCHRVRVGRSIQSDCFNYHYLDGCGTSSRFQASSKMACKAGEGAGGERQYQEQHFRQKIQTMVWEVCHVSASIHHSASRRPWSCGLCRRCRSRPSSNIFSPRSCMRSCCWWTHWFLHLQVSRNT